MTTKVQHSVSTVAVVGSTVSAPREVVPAEVYEGIDFAALNRKVADTAA